MLVNMPCATATNDILDDTIAATLGILADLNSNAISSDRMQRGHRVAEVGWPRDQPTYLASVFGRHRLGVAPADLRNAGATGK
jgi:hypothetical protein